jgi:hypothetical protein
MRRDRLRVYVAALVPSADRGGAMRLLSLLVLACAALTGLSACGSNSKSSTSSTSQTTAQLPRAEFAQKADAICRQGQQKLRSGPRPPNFNPATATSAQVKSATAFLQSDAANTQEEVSRVSALGEPAEAAARQAWTKLRTSLETQSIPLIQKVAQAAAAGDVTALRAGITRLNGIAAFQRPLVQAIGFKVCGGG